MANPILAELTRGGIVETVHRGSVAVFDADGGNVLSLGDVERPVFPRSAYKLIQALPLVETGAADHYGFGQKELSLACASHSSEPGHVDLAAKMLGAAGLGEPDLECGSHWPIMGSAGEITRIELAQSGNTPNQLYNNCSGKHAGFLCCAKHAGLKTSGYIKPEHEIQRHIFSVFETLVGEKITADQCGIDGCSAPTLAASLTGLAKAFAKLAAGTGLEPVRAKAAKRLMDACMAQPWYMAGTNRFCTRVMELGEGRIFAKMGAEGVYMATIPEMGLGIAIKADDGADRAGEMILAGVLNMLMGNDTSLGEKLKALTHQPMYNWNRMHIGDIRSCPI